MDLFDNDTNIYFGALNDLNLLVFCSDLCRVLEPLYSVEVPLVMNNEVYAEIVEKLTSNNDYTIRAGTNMLFFCFKMMRVYMSQQNSNSFDLTSITHNVMMKSLYAEPLTLFEVWKNLLCLSVSGEDWNRVVSESPSESTPYTIRPYFQDSISERVVLERVVETGSLLLTEGLKLYQEYLQTPSQIINLDLHNTYKVQKRDTHVQPELSVLSSWNSDLVLSNQSPEPPVFYVNTDLKKNTVSLVNTKLPASTVFGKELLYKMSKLHAEHQLHARLDQLLQAAKSASAIAGVTSGLQGGAHTKLVLHSQKDASWFLTYFGMNEEAAQGDALNNLITIQTDVLSSLLDKPESGWYHRRVRFTLTNGRQFDVGSFSLLNLEGLRSINNGNAFTSQLPTNTVGLSYSYTPGNISTLIYDNLEDSVFQAASQFNLLEMERPEVTPEQGIIQYIFDDTQGPRVALSSPAALFYRNYLIFGQPQTQSRQIDTFYNVYQHLEQLGLVIHYHNENGYLVVQLNPQWRQKVTEQDLESLVETHLTVGVHWDAPLITESDKKVCQVYSAALPIAYYDYYLENKDLVAPLAIAILTATYKMALQVGVNKLSRESPRVTVFLTAVGGGAFGNKRSWIQQALLKALQEYLHFPLDVNMIYFGDPFSELTEATVRPKLELQSHRVNASVASPSLPQEEEEERCVNQSIKYIGPQTDFNCCYMNSVLVALLMFPAPIVVQRLVLPVQKQHILKNENLCLGDPQKDDLVPVRIQGIETVKMEARNNSDYVLTYSTLKNIIYCIDFDCIARTNLKKALYDLLIEFSNTSKSGRVTKEDRVRSFRNQVVDCSLNCQQLSSNPARMYGNTGEPEGVLELFQFIMFKNNIRYVKTRKYSDAKGEPLLTCVENRTGTENLLFNLPLPEQGEHKISELLSKQDVSIAKGNFINTRGVPDVEVFECKYQKKYHRLEEYYSSLSGSIICFSVSRGRLTVARDGSVVLELDTTKSLYPDKELTLFELQLKLTAVIVTWGAHYVCFVRPQTQEMWYYFNGGGLCEVGSFEAMLQYSGNIEGLQGQAKRQGVIYVYT